MNKSFIVFLLLFSCLLDIGTMCYVKNFIPLEVNPVYLTLGFWFFLILKIAINIGFVFTFLNFSKHSNNLLSFAAYYTIILLIFGQFMGATLNFVTTKDVYNDIQEENSGKYASINEVTEQDIAKYTADKKSGMIYYFVVVFSNIILPALLTFTSFYLWNKNEN